MELKDSPRPLHTGRGEEFDRRVDRLQREADRLYMRERYADAEDKVRELLRLQDDVLGADHPDYADSLGMLGELLFIQDDLEGAEAQLRRALKVRGRISGCPPLDYATSLNSLALVLWQRGQWDEAERLLGLALDIRQVILGWEHGDTLRNRDNLETLRSQRALPAEEALVDVRDDFSDRDLAGELAALQDWFFDLQERLIEAARALRTSGTPPAERFLTELADCRIGFSRLCAGAGRLAGELGVPCPPAAELENIQQITTLLHAIAQAVVGRSERETVRQEALVVLDRVAGLTHAERPTFAPLRMGQERAEFLRQTIARAPGNDLPADADRLATGGDPLNDLLSLIDDRRRLTDEEWSRRHLSVSATFSPALAAAATRGKLGAPREPAPVRPQVPPSISVPEPEPEPDRTHPSEGALEYAMALDSIASRRPEADEPFETQSATDAPWSFSSLSALLQDAGPFQRMAWRVMSGPLSLVQGTFTPPDPADALKRPRRGRRRNIAAAFENATIPPR